MADSYIQLPPNSTGVKFDTFELVVGANTVHRGGYRVVGEAADEVARVLNAIPATTDYGLVVRPVGPATQYADPQTSHVKSLSLSPGGAVRLNSAQISAGKTGYPIAFVISSTVPWQAQLQLSNDGSTGDDQMVWTSDDQIPPIPRGLFTVAYSAAAGLDGWSIRVTNQDPSRTADFYGTFFWDES